MTKQTTRSRSLSVLGAATAALVLVTGMAGASLLGSFLVSRASSVPVSECNDGVDNDGDGRKDRADPSCLWSNSEGRRSSRSVLLRRRAILRSGGEVVAPAPASTNTSHTSASDEAPAAPRTFRIPWVRFFNSAPASPSPSDTAAGGVSGGGVPCADRIDNDLDGMTDGADPGCRCSSSENANCGSSACADRTDNDLDGMTDSADPDCACSGGATESATCHGSAPECTDGVDNDVDGMTDSADPSCACAQSESAACPQPPVTTGPCTDHTDNDLDGMTDSADPDCACSGGASETACGSSSIPTPAPLAVPAAQ